MSLDHTVSFKKHLKITQMKVRSEIHLLQKLGIGIKGIDWMDSHSLRTTSLALGLLDSRILRSRLA